MITFFECFVCVDMVNTKRQVKLSKLKLMSLVNNWNVQMENNILSWPRISVRKIRFYKTMSVDNIFTLNRRENEL